MRHDYVFISQRDYHSRAKRERERGTKMTSVIKYKPEADTKILPPASTHVSRYIVVSLALPIHKRIEE